MTKKAVIKVTLEELNGFLDYFAQVDGLAGTDDNEEDLNVDFSNKASSLYDKLVAARNKLERGEAADVSIEDDE